MRSPFGECARHNGIDHTCLSTLARTCSMARSSRSRNSSAGETALAAGGAVPFPPDLPLRRFFAMMPPKAERESSPDLIGAANLDMFTRGLSQVQLGSAVRSPRERRGE